VFTVVQLYFYTIATGEEKGYSANVMINNPLDGSTDQWSSASGPIL